MLVGGQQHELVRAVLGQAQGVGAIVVRDCKEVELAQLGVPDLLSCGPAEGVRLVRTGVVVAGTAVDVVAQDRVGVEVAGQPAPARVVQQAAEGGAGQSCGRRDRARSLQ
jgi:hypothetical protein